MKTLQLPHGQLQLPVFLPDATMGVVRSVDSADLTRCGVQGVVMNTFHLMQHP
ncbi:MAG: tRNA-guanine transglycosylase, partial [Anaerolineae bacterium]